MPSATASRTVCSAVNCGSCGRNPIRIPGIGTASPSNSRFSPALIRNSGDLPDAVHPSTPILAPGKNDREMSLRMTRFGGTIFPTRFIVYTYWAMATVRERVGYRPRLSQAHRIGVGDELCQPRQTGDGVAKSRVCPHNKAARKAALFARCAVRGYCLAVVAMTFGEPVAAAASVAVRNSFQRFLSAS